MLRAHLRPHEVSNIIISATMSVPGEVSPESLMSHRRTDGFLDAGYHYFIDHHARVRSGVPVTERGSWLPRHSGDSIFLLLDGGRRRQWEIADTFTEEQLSVVNRLTRQLQKEYPSARQVLHRELFKGINPVFNKERLNAE